MSAREELMEEMAKRTEEANDNIKQGKCEKRKHRSIV